jgi:hypothetical protein
MSNALAALNGAFIPPRAVLHESLATALPYIQGSDNICTYEHLLVHLRNLYNREIHGAPRLLQNYRIQMDSEIPERVRFSVIHRDHRGCTVCGKFSIATDVANIVSRAGLSNSQVRNFPLHVHCSTIDSLSRLASRLGELFTHRFQPKTAGESTYLYVSSVQPYVFTF